MDAARRRLLGRKIRQDGRTSPLLLVPWRKSFCSGIVLVSTCLFPLVVTWGPFYTCNLSFVSFPVFSVCTPTVIEISIAAECNSDNQEQRWYLSFGGTGTCRGVSTAV